MSDTTRFRQGAVVRHKTKGYIGIFDGFTRIKSLFELPDDSIGCRVVVEFGLDANRHIASPRNLDVISELVLEDRHKANLAFFGVPWKGISPTKSGRRRRVTRCWFCKHPLDNAVDSECNTCRWILCQCGACGCGFKLLS